VCRGSTVECTELRLLLPLQHAKGAKTEHKTYKKQMKRQKEKVKQLVDGPEQCIHCDKDPCDFIQIEMRLCKNDDIYYDSADY
jgi:Fe-S-cluster-containing dehydrogenase component